MDELIERRLVLPKTQARFGRQSVISLFLIQYFDSIFLLMQRIAFQRRELFFQASTMLDGGYLGLEY